MDKNVMQLLSAKNEELTRLREEINHINRKHKQYLDDHDHELQKWKGYYNAMQEQYQLELAELTENYNAKHMHLINETHKQDKLTALQKEQIKQLENQVKYYLQESNAYTDKVNSLTKEKEHLRN